LEVSENKKIVNIMEQEYVYDVAISFADEDGKIAKSLSIAFKNIGISAYYYDDDDERIKSWGLDLKKSLTEIYRDKAKYAVVLFSKNYFAKKKKYTRVELKAILQRMRLEVNSVYMLPIKFGEDYILEEFPDLIDLTYLPWNDNPEDIAEKIKVLLGKKLVNKEDIREGKAFIYNSGINAKIISGEDANDINPEGFKNARTDDVSIEINDIIPIIPFVEEFKIPPPFFSGEDKIKLKDLTELTVDGISNSGDINLIKLKMPFIDFKDDLTIELIKFDAIEDIESISNNFKEFNYQN
jgi:hypothetical protein